MNQPRTDRVMLLLPPADPLRYPEAVRHLHIEFLSVADQKAKCYHCDDDVLVQGWHMWAYMDFLQAHRRGEAERAPVFVCYACEPEAVLKEFRETGCLPTYEKATNKYVRYDTQYL